ncbi:MAG: PqqD family protein [Gemmatimonadota bacterium]|nr:MAG: PqqD family protein [Gemmatimonadota bacterium]
MLDRRKLKELEAVNLLDISPVRVAEWEEQGGRVVVVRPKPEVSGLRGLLNRFFYSLAARRLRLDEMGSAGWRLLDGERTVGEIAGQLREQFGEGVEPAEERFGHLVRVLRREDLVVYPGWDDG